MLVLVFVFVIRDMHVGSELRNVIASALKLQLRKHIFTWSSTSFSRGYLVDCWPRACRLKIAQILWIRLTWWRYIRGFGLLRSYLSCYICISIRWGRAWAVGKFDIFMKLWLLSKKVEKMPKNRKQGRESSTSHPRGFPVDGLPRAASFNLWSGM